MLDHSGFTDPQDELFDVLDDAGNPTGVAKPRRLVHRDGDWHRGLHIWVGFLDEAGRSHVIFQRRSMTKDTFPGALDVAVGGHVRSGETLEETVREADEEIGLRVELSDLVPIGRRWARGGHDAIRDNELNEVFAVRSDWAVTDYRQHPEEVSAIIAAPVDDTSRLFEGDLETVEVLECPRGALDPRRSSVRRADFATSDDRYALLALVALDAVLHGETPEPFELRSSRREG